MSEQMKPTPGPWFILNGQLYGPIPNTRYKFNFASLKLNNYEDEGVLDEIKANGELIVLACNWFQDMAERGGWDVREMPEQIRWVMNYAVGYIPYIQPLPGGSKEAAAKEHPELARFWEIRAALAEGGT